MVWSLLRGERREEGGGREGGGRERRREKREGGMLMALQSGQLLVLQVCVCSKSSHLLTTPDITLWMTLEVSATEGRERDLYSFQAAQLIRTAVHKIQVTGDRSLHRFNQISVATLGLMITEVKLVMLKSCSPLVDLAKILNQATYMPASRKSNHRAQVGF